jgi:antitoxin component YwqK of YwqJK toxin-antitoxin module
MRILFGVMFLFVSSVFSQNVTDANGQKQGSWSKVYPGTRVFQYRGQFKDDRPVGTFTYYYPSSKLKAIINHVENSNRSEGVYYHENGDVMSKGVFRDFKKDSIWCNYSPSGRLINKESYKNDLLNGKTTVYYVPEDPNDKSLWILSIANFKEGKYDGEYLEYFQGGSPKTKGFYDMNRKTGVWINYDVTGSKTIEESYSNGFKHGWSFAYDAAGKVVSKQYYLDGRHIQGKELEVRINQIKFNAKKSEN